MSQSPQQNAVVQVDYWRESRRPLVSLVFVSPLLVIYEGGVLLLGETAMRNGADAWLRMFLRNVGFGQYLLLPVLTVGILLGWHHVNRDPWRVSKWVLSGMAGECLSLSLVLVAIAYVQGAVLGSLFSLSSISGEVPNLWLTPTASLVPQFISKAIAFCGAGIYEEVLFRLILMTGLTVLFQLAGASTQRSAWVAVIISSLLFSLAHYIGAEGDTFRIDSFLFRFIAGAFFAVLFMRRGFGITAGTHALYDMIVGLLL